MCVCWGDNLAPTEEVGGNTSRTSEREGRRTGTKERDTPDTEERDPKFRRYKKRRSR